MGYGRFCKAILYFFVDPGGQASQGEGHGQYGKCGKIECLGKKNVQSMWRIRKVCVAPGVWRGKDGVSGVLEQRKLEISKIE